MNKPTRTVIAGESYAGMFKRAANQIAEISVNIFQTKRIEKSEDEKLRAFEALESCDVIFLFRSSESCWEEIEDKVNTFNKAKPVISIGHDPSLWLLSTVKPDKIGRASCRERVYVLV